jgi:LmbE family N-acetylglucosaminyl deacetylase|tara:strand:+ start:9879 stop:10550 length:672 start_codon:yes stop_codon:yes gene_type:complete
MEVGQTSSLVFSQNLNNEIKSLIISPHADDEVLAMGGTLNEGCYVYYCGLDESKVAPDPKHRIPMEDRKVEIENTSKFLGYKYEIGPGKVNFYVEQEIIAAIEELVNRLKPEQIFIPLPSYNQDHKTVYRAAQVALRPHDKNHFVKKVLVYEQAHSIIWEQSDFKPTYFVPIDVEKKIQAYKLQPSQVRPFRSPETIRAIAKLRGSQANCGHAEAFKIERWVE